RDAGVHQFRAAGPADRPRPVRLDGEEEAGGVFLMGSRGQGPEAGGQGLKAEVQRQDQGVEAALDAGSEARVPPRSPAPDLRPLLHAHESKPLLRFIPCGSVDDGKSTLIGRLLYESKRLFDDQLAALEADSRRHGTQGERIDYALLLDGL